MASAEHDGHHGFADDSGRRNDADIGAFIGGFGRFARFQIDRFERPAQRGDRLEKAAHPQILAVRHAAFEAAGAVVAAEETAVFAVVMNRVLHFRTETLRALLRPADFHAFDGLHGDDGLREFAIETRIPGDVGAEPRRQTVRHYFKDAADRVAGSISFIDDRFHFLFGVRIDAAEQHFGLPAELHNLVPGDGAFQPASDRRRSRG